MKSFRYTCQVRDKRGASLFRSTVKASSPTDAAEFLARLCRRIPGMDQIRVKLRGKLWIYAVSPEGPALVGYAG